MPKKYRMSKKKFNKVDPKQSFPKLEEGIIKDWKKNKIFERSVESRSKEQEYVFYDGPPFATGLPHYGHILAGTIKDVVPRYWTMRGYRVERVFGWDCHGLPVEYQIEKELGLNGRQDIVEKMGIATFNEECRKNVLRYTKEWEKTVERMGRWVDFKNAYRTMDPTYMESIWWVFKTLWDKGLIYEGHKPMHICPRCVTPLSNFEVTLGYKEVNDQSVYVKFRSKEDKNTYFVAWTTTPWTLLGNAALAINPDIDYVKVGYDFETNPDNVSGEDEKFFIIIAKSIYEKWKYDPKFTGAMTKIWGMDEHTQKKNVQWFESKTYVGKELVGKEYEPLFEPPIKLENQKNAWKIYAGNFVKTEEGTGIVHVAPAFGEDDLLLGKKNNLPLIQHINIDGTLKKEWNDSWMENVKKNSSEKNEKTDSIKRIDIQDLQQKVLNKLKKNDSKKGTRLLAQETIKHSYPHCWRCETPLLNYATASWFMNVESLKKAMIESNKKIHWMPTHIKEGRFGKWLENARDWCVSRNRYWGTPLPIWRCTQCKETLCVGSTKNLEVLSGKKVNDIHKHFIDDITFPCEKCEGTMKRIEEVLDCWFESGSMPYAQKHYPFENKKWMIDHFPADFIAEGLDQTRGWFYTLHVLSTALSPDITKKGVQPAFRNIIVNGIVLAEDGSKMSKSKKNYPDPRHIFNNYGADAVRFYLMNSPVVRAEDLRFSEKGVSDVVKNVLLPIWNAYGFFVMYAEVDQWQPDRKPVNDEKNEKKSNKKSNSRMKNKLDRWILSALNRLIADVTTEMDNYDLQAIKPIYSFIHDLTNWYIRRSRRRFWKSENDDDKNEAYETLYAVLKILAQLLAPWMPFISEEIYKNLTGEESVHLTDWPEADKKMIDEKLNREFEITQIIVNLGRRARLKANIKIRQPLGKIEIVLPENIHREIIEDQLSAIKEELNMKEIEFLSDTKKIATAFAVPNPRVLGPKYGKDVQEIIRAAKNGQFKKLPNGNIRVLHYDLLPEEIEIGYHGKEGFDVESEQGIVIAIDTTITEKLKMEGIARDIVRLIQGMRKDADYNVNNRIRVRIEGTDIIKKVIEQFGEYIQKETLADSLCDSIHECDIKKECVIDEEKFLILVKKTVGKYKT